MNSPSLPMLLLTLLLFAVFAAIVCWTLGRKRKHKLEQPKFRMLDDE